MRFTSDQNKWAVTLSLAREGERGGGPKSGAPAQYKLYSSELELPPYYFNLF